MEHLSTDELEKEFVKALEAKDDKRALELGGVIFQRIIFNQALKEAIGDEHV